ncbi:cobalamin biosynthesis protein [Oscillatoriales cyanobacterium LEGE 11467]|uniref:Cobalamin biosynthesis protein CobD n=1 Tax=Zarconia navalis LEGE 11467 TaxID=1828826 RepID=A0A928VYX5_9CYAN|nr:adenosylcobinamide-phosphate synthase CbiB [Zarconia navalis]MBE9040230.1 cobalamin biosynthesis protein [Zarconia navalis LEGE 11467]
MHLDNDSLIVLAIAVSLDYLIGDPQTWPHPVQFMGWVIDGYTQFTIARSKNLRLRQWAGVVGAIALIGGSALVGGAIVTGAYRLHPLLGIFTESTLLASCFAGRSLRRAATEVLQPLALGNIADARQRLSLYVGRDTQNLTQGDILRAVLETISENATDGVMAPLFYALLGTGFPDIGSVPFALAYKGASTLDSMVGYREEPFTQIGWFSAKLEDVLTWLPCRLTVITLGLLGGKLPTVWSLCQRDAKLDPSPNSGWSECAYAAILGVQLGGTNWYRGIPKHKPKLGDPHQPISPQTIERALKLTRYCFLCWLGVGFLVFSLWRALG